MTRPRRILSLALVALAVGGAGVLGVLQWRAKAMARQEAAAVARAEALLKDGKPAEALALAETFTKLAPGQTWPKIELAALTSLQNLPRLALIFEQSPARLLADEEASVLLARGFLHARKSDGFSKVREAWRGREHRSDSWLALDVDAFLLAGKPREAEKLLRSKTLAGADDTTRLIRLALVTANRDMAGAWKLLAQAAALQPTNADVRSFRGQILETAGKIELARVEYVAAVVAAPRDTLLRDQLADFYLRNRNHDLALDTWTEALGQGAFDFIWLKTQFWSRVLRPINIPAKLQPPAGDLEPLVRQIANLKPGRFFDTNAFEALPGFRTYASQRQEVFWLRLLDMLQTGREAEALDFLQAQPAKLRTWDPDLAAALQRILYFRQKRSLNPPGFAFTSSFPEASRHPFLSTLEEAARQERSAQGRANAPAPELAALLRGSAAFCSAFLAAGWREAALQLQPELPASPNQPEWLGYGYTQALRVNRGPKAALAALGTAVLQPASELLRAELLVEGGRREEALGRLKPLAQLNSSVGFRAAYLLALDAVEHHQLQSARQQVAQQPLLANDTLGKELLARLALVEGKTTEAEQIYRGISDTSVEAKTWFARQAYAQGRWKEARRLTNELLELMPDSPQLRENLLSIDQAEARR